MSDRTIEPIARAVILLGDDIVLCQAVGKDWYYLPGGHIEYGETARAAIVREMGEELGVTVRVGEFLGGAENQFVQDGKEHHEINLIFSAALSDQPLQSKEDHIQFVRVPLKTLSGITILPKPLHAALLRWIETRQPFWIE